MPVAGGLGHLDADPALAGPAEGDLEGDRSDAARQRRPLVESREDLGRGRRVLAPRPHPKGPDGLPRVGRAELDVVEVRRRLPGQGLQRECRLGRVELRHASHVLLEPFAIRRRAAGADEQQRMPEPLDLDRHVGVEGAHLAHERAGAVRARRHVDAPGLLPPSRGRRLDDARASRRRPAPVQRVEHVRTGREPEDGPSLAHRGKRRCARTRYVVRSVIAAPSRPCRAARGRAGGCARRRSTC
ncbi:MAG: hypothetical protein AVDCRST_MAG30-1568 [uncultured Solirubrobacteraceae bacterium]|uniref:Uncharacterized protein n=1 Tax=uncultured Solirubrobacteraceae bacterium TaxID=1162706 RepID=A0A6J4SIG1_9ACTN|nr:MAG: hypothetical protein AVDCRST_MAG30-1568 [uncultured Solirubrobacteraceae bacterium]